MLAALRERQVQAARRQAEEDEARGRAAQDAARRRSEAEANRRRAAQEAARSIEDSDRLWRVGTSAFDDKLYPTARRTLEEFVAKYPEDRRTPEAWLLLGKARFAQQDLGAALDAFRRALGFKDPPGQPGEAKFWEAETLFRLKRAAEAEAAYDSALQIVLEKDPKLPFAADTMYGRAWAQLDQKRLEPAIKSFRDLLETWPQSPLAPSATFALARTLVDLKRYDEALPLLAPFETKYPQSKQVPEARYLLGWTRLTAGQTSEGIQALRAFVAAYPTHELAETARHQLSDAVLRAGDRGDLETSYRAVMAESRPTPDDLYAAGQMAARLGRPEDQEAAWKRLRQEFPDHSLAQRTALELARAAHAAEHWAEAAKNDEFRAEASLLLGEAALKLKDYPRALEAFRTVTGTAGVDKGLRYRALAGTAVAQEEQQQWGEALGLYEEVAQGSPDAALQGWAREAVLTLGKSRLEAGDLERALDAFRRAERLQPPVFGYRNVEVRTSGGQRSHVERAINPEEAVVVRRIFEACARGVGFRRIAHDLNEAGSPAPRPSKGGPRGWAPSTVRAVLHRELYRGVIVWNRTQKRDVWGQKRPRPRAEGEWVRKDAPDLRIIPEELWQAAHDRLRGSRDTYLRGHRGAAVGPAFQRHRVKISLDGDGGVRAVRRCPDGALAQPRPAPWPLLPLPDERPTWAGGVR